MATIRKHRGKWQAIVRRKGRGSTSKTFQIRRDAERWARDQERKLDNGTFGKLAPHEVTLAELLTRYGDTITVTKKGAPQEKRRIQRLLKDPLTSLAADQITSVRLASFRDKRLRDGIRAAAIDLILIGHCFKIAMNELPKAQVTKLIGIGVATPFDLDGWEGVINAPKGEMSKWKDIHVASEVERLTGQKTFLLNDATAACLAELRTSKDRQETSFLYFYVGTFLGGGIVLDGKIYNGIHGNAGSVGSMPTSLSSGKHPTQMVSAAAIHKLEVMAIKAGLPRNAFDNEEPLDLKRKEVFDDWSNEASNALAFAVISGQSFFDLGDIVIDGSIRRDLLGTLIEKIEESFTRYELQGLKVPNISAGHLGNDARAIGGSLLPLQQRYGLDQSLILKSNLTN